MKARMKFWQFASFFGAIPAVGLALAIILPASHESKKKPRDEYVNYPYMHRITKVRNNFYTIFKQTRPLHHRFFLNLDTFLFSRENIDC